MTGNKKVFRVHLRKDVGEILFKKHDDLGRFGVILDDHLSFVEQIAFKNVSVMALMHFASLSVGRERYWSGLIVSSALIAPGA
ncbi:hypothetical protein GCM10028805_35600 [Spirosoma harenae]